MCRLHNKVNNIHSLQSGPCIQWGGAIAPVCTPLATGLYLPHIPTTYIYLPHTCTYYIHIPTTYIYLPHTYAYHIHIPTTYIHVHIFAYDTCPHGSMHTTHTNTSTLASICSQGIQVCQKHSHHAENRQCHTHQVNQMVTNVQKYEGQNHYSQDSKTVKKLYTWGIGWYVWCVVQCVL